MAWTHDQKMAATLLSLTNYRNSLAPNDPDLPKANEHVAWRAIAKAYGEDVISAAKGGMGPGGLDTPPVPPTP